MLGFKQFQMTTNDPFLKAILIIPCFGHLTSNAFLDLAKTNSHFYDLFYAVLQTARFIRTNQAVKYHNVKCPTYSTTRWLYIVDVLLFMLIHKDEINSYIEIANALDKPSCPKVGQDFEFLCNHLIWLKSLSLVLEKNGLQFFNIIPLVRGFFVQLALLYKSTDNKDYRGIIDSLDSIMRVRLLQNAYSETITSYVLSGNGSNIKQSEL